MNNIKGPILSETQIKFINSIKDLEQEVKNQLVALKEQTMVTYDPRWLATGTTDIEKGFMCIVKSLSSGSTLVEND